MGAEAARSESSPHLCGDQNFADVADFARGFQPRTAGQLIIPNTTEAMDTGNLWGRQ